MEINGVGSNTTAVADTTAKTPNAASATVEDNQKPDTTVNETAAVYEPNVDGKYTVKWDSVEKMLEEANRQAESFRRMIEGVFNKQGQTYEQSIRKIASGMFEADAATIKKAQEDVSEDGYYGVKQTSERILNFAKAITGGDPSKIEEMRSAIQKGFGEAEKVWGGKMPDITQQTYDAVMKGLDEWAESSKAI